MRDMTADELAQKLREMYDEAEHKEQTSMVALFGVKYAKELEDYNVSKIVRAAFGTGVGNRSAQVGIGQKLARYVTLK